MEVLLPYLQMRYRRKQNKILKIRDMLELDDSRDSYYDYLELFTQFGFVFLFLPIFPYGPLLGFLNSCLEIRLDGMKFCFCLKRPLQRSAKGINNAWIEAFQYLTIIAVITNLTLFIFISESFQQLALFYGISSFNLMVIVEVNF